ncbi:MAG: ABC transporter permease subunit [Oscillospiraceae bacterium]|jgi:ABC-type transport system involved in multi-copper enzyme maturation permease subunit|nr:ABC transporter permease subunit [Oscillospiraceae bacterium]
MKNLLHSEFYKLWISGSFRGFAIGTIISALISVVFINSLEPFTTNAPKDLVEQMVMNGVYNFGFIKVDSISDLTAMTSIFVMTSAFTNYCPLILVAIFISKFINTEFENGGIRNFLLKGYNRNEVIFSKYIASMTIIATIMLTYFLIYCVMSTIIFSYTSISIHFFLDLVAFLFAEIFLIISFATLCFSISMFSQRRTTVLLNASMVLLGDMFIKVILIMTNGQLNLSSFWVLGFVSNIKPSKGIDVNLFVVAIITLIIPFILAQRRFKRLEFK